MKSFYYYDRNDDEFEYEVDRKSLLIAVEKELQKIAKVKSGESEPAERLIKLLTDDCSSELYDALVDYLEEDLHEYFKEEAQESRQNAIAVEKESWQEYRRDKI